MLARENGDKYFQTVIDGDLEQFKLFIQKGIDINSIDYSDTQWTALIYAARYDRRNILQYCLQQNAIHINHKNTIGRTALNYAIFNNNLDIVQDLVVAGCDVDIMDNDGKTPVQFALLIGQYAIARWLVREAKVNIEIPDEEGCTLLHNACNANDTELAKELITVHGANYLKKTNFQCNLIHLSCLTGNTKLYDWLIRENIPINKNEKINGQTLLHLAVLRSNPGMVKKLLEEYPEHIHVKDDDFGYTPLHYAAMHGDVSIIKLLVNAGANCNEVGSSGYLAVHLAAVSKQISAVRFFLDNCGMNVDEKNIQTGETLLHCACRGGYTPLVQLLIENYYADVRAVTKDCRSIKTIGQFHQELTNYLNHRNDYLVTNYLNKLPIHFLQKMDGNTLLHFACLHGLTELVSLLLENSADITEQNDNGKSAIHLAAMSGSENILHILIKAGADPQMLDRDGCTPLHYACAYSHLHLIKVLIETYHVDLTIKTSAELNNVTALDIALDKLIDKVPITVNIVTYLFSIGAGISANLKTRLNPWNMYNKNALLINTTCNDQEITSLYGINSNKELANAVINNIDLNFDMIRRTVQLKLANDPNNENLKQTYHILTTFRSLKDASFFKLAETKQHLLPNNLPEDCNKKLKRVGEFEERTLRLLDNNKNSLAILKQSQSVNAIIKASKIMAEDSIVDRIRKLFYAYAHPPLFSLHWRSHQPLAAEIANTLSKNNWTGEECRSYVLNLTKNINMEEFGSFKGIINKMENMILAEKELPAQKLYRKF